MYVAMAHATRLLEDDPALAAEQALAILEAVPNHPPAVLLLATARRLSGDLEAALEILESLVQQQANWAAAHCEYGVALGQARRGDGAIEALQRTVEL